MNEVSPPLLSVVIPLYQEGAHLLTTLPKIVAVLDALGENYEVVLVDDGSSDNTWQAMCEQRASITTTLFLSSRYATRSRPKSLTDIGFAENSRRVPSQYQDVG